MTNKNINGKNKEERVKNKLLKYFNIQLSQNPKSNKYISIEKVENVFCTIFENTKLVNTKYGEKIVIQSQNMESPVWIPSWAIFQLSNGMVCFKPYKNEDIEKCKRIAKGFDDLEIVKVGDLVDRKNAFQIRK